MFLRIFRYRVKPQMRDRHLAVQARAARLYEQHVQHSPKYFRRSGDANSWVELHWYADKEECQRVAATVADDIELTRLWRDFQETLDPDYPPALEEFGEYELPRPVNASPFSQPPIDAQESEPRREAPERPAATAAPIAAEIADDVADEPAAAAPQESPQVPPKVQPEESGRIDDDGAGHSAKNGEAKRQEASAPPPPQRDEDTVPDIGDDDLATQRTMWPRPPIPADIAQDDLIIEDDAPSEEREGNSLSFNDGVWIVEPEEKPRAPRGDDN